MRHGEGCRRVDREACLDIAQIEGKEDLNEFCTHFIEIHRDTNGKVPNENFGIVLERLYNSHEKEYAETNSLVVKFDTL